MSRLDLFFSRQKLKKSEVTCGLDIAFRILTIKSRLYLVFLPELDITFELDL